MLSELSLPEGLELIRTTDEFTPGSVPKGLLRSHHVAVGVWGLLRVVEGSVVFVLETTGESRTVGAGESQVIEPSVSHHVEPGEGSRFLVEFHR